MPRFQFRIPKPTLALFKEEDGYVGRPLPEGAAVSFDPQSLASGTLIEVVWKDNLVLMFASDLAVRAVPENVEVT